MNEYVPAVLSALAIALPLLASTSIQGRRLSRMQGEAELLATLPDELVAERQLARLSLHQSLWEYTVARSRLSPSRTLAWSLLGVLVFYVGRLETIPFLDEPISLGGLRIPFMLLGAALYFMPMFISGSRLRSRMKALQGAPPSRVRQLLALEAATLDDADLAGTPTGQPGRFPIRPPDATRGRLAEWFWRPLDQWVRATRTQPRNSEGPEVVVDPSMEQGEGPGAKH